MHAIDRFKAVGRHRRDVRARVTIAMAAIFVLTLFPSVSQRSLPAHAQTTGDPTVPTTNYTVPSAALFVATDGADANLGTKTAPLRSIGEAVRRASAGATIVIRGGVYRESAGHVSKRIILQPYPNETVWWKGSEVVTNWVQDGSRWRRDNWTPRFCQTCYDSRELDPAYPNAGRPDMVFVDGQPLVQVQSAAQVGPGGFFVDYSTSQLYIGTNPSGRVVEGAARPFAIQLDPGAAGSIVRGLGFSQFAPLVDQSQPAMVVGNAASLTFENNVFSSSASRGLTLHMTTDGVVRGNTFFRNGLQGLQGHLIHRALIEGNSFVFNNHEHFWAYWGAATEAAGAKITRTKDLRVRWNQFDDNYATGFWCDESCYNLTLADNTMRRNEIDGLSVELGTNAIVASNLTVNNGKIGIKISGTTNAQIYNNTVANNQQQIGVYEDARRNTDAAELSLGITWDTRNVMLINNILSTKGSSGELLHTHDNNQPQQVGASEMIPTADYDAYYRASSGSPTVLARWAIKGGDAYYFRTLDALKSGTGREGRGIGADNFSVSPVFVDEVSGNYSVKTGSAVLGTGKALPSDIAAAIGVSAGVAVDRGVLRGPTMSTATTTTTTTISSTVPGPSGGDAVYRLYRAETGDHFYTIDASERDAAASYGYRYEQVGFKAWRSGGAEQVAVHRLYHPQTGDHFYTIDAAEKDAAVARYGYQYEKVAFYAAPSARTGVVPTYRLLKASNGDHFYTVRTDERDGAVASYGYQYERIAFYVLPPG